MNKRLKITMIGMISLIILILSAFLTLGTNYPACCCLESPKLRIK